VLGVWVPDPRGEKDRRKHLLISPIHPSVWPFLLRLEIKLRDQPGKMARAAEVLLGAGLNIQFAECGISGHHHATWNVIAEANDVRGGLQDNPEFQAVQGLPSEQRIYSNIYLEDFSNRLAALMLAKAVDLPRTMEQAHRMDESYAAGEIDCGFLHNRIVDKELIRFFYEPDAMPTPELAEVARKGLPQAVTCRWMQSLAFFALYGDMRHPIRLQYDLSTRLLKLSDDGHRGFGRVLERQGQRISLPARAVASYDTAGLHLRIDIIEPTEARSQFIRATVDYEIEFASDPVPGKDDTAAGLWLGVCEQAARHGIDLMRISNRTTHRDHQSEAGAFTLIGRTEAPIDDRLVDDLNSSFRRECRPAAKNARCGIASKTSKFQSYTLFVSRRSTMPMFDEIDGILADLAGDWGFELECVKDDIGKLIDGEIERKLRQSDGFLQIVSYSNAELSDARGEPDLQWLIHEYGLAIGAGKPHARVFDVTRRPLQQWQQVLMPGGGEAAGSYSTNQGLPSVRKELEKVFAALTQQIDTRRRARTR
jgi:hypothetical protein